MNVTPILFEHCHAMHEFTVFGFADVQFRRFTMLNEKRMLKELLAASILLKQKVNKFARICRILCFLIIVQILYENVGFKVNHRSY